MERDTATTAQQQKFIEAAREHGCDEDEAAFGAKLRRIAAVKPKPTEQPSAEKADAEKK